MRATVAVALMLGAWLLTGATAGAAELVVFRSDGCAWCKIWDRDIGQVYDKTPEGRRLPIRYVDIDKPRPADLRAVADVRYTPTFVVFDDSVEIGRIVGYPGPDFFWGYLGELIQRLEKRNALWPTPRRASSFGHISRLRHRRSHSRIRRPRGV